MRTPKKWITVIIDPTNHSASLSGLRVKELIEQCGGRPMWSRRRRAWCTSESVASDVLALADADNYGIRFTMLGVDAE